MAWGSKPSTNLLTSLKESLQDLVPFQLLIAWPLASLTSKASYVSRIKKPMACRRLRRLFRISTE
jgi:hypothetical protein